MADDLNVLPVEAEPTTQETVDSLPTTTFDQQISKLRGELAQVAATKSVELAQQKEINKLPVTRNSFEAAYDVAAKSPDYETFVANVKEKSPELGTDRAREIYAEVSNARSDAIKNQGKEAVFSDAELNDSFVKPVINAGIGLVGRVSDIAGNLLNVGAELPQALRKAGISEADYQTAKVIKQKEDIYQDSVDAQRHETDPAKKEILQQRIDANSPNSYTPEEKAFFESKDVEIVGMGGSSMIQKQDSAADRMRKIGYGNRIQESIDTVSGAITSVANQSNIQTMMESAWADYTHANVKDIPISGVVDLAMEAGKTIVDNPGALAQLVAQTVPDIITASRAMPAALLGNFSEKQREAKQIYLDTYGEEARGADLAKLNGGAVAAALLDTYGDRLVGKGGVDLVGLAQSAGLRSGSKLLDVTAKAATKITQAGATGAVGEFIAEGGGQLITQLAGTQDFDKVKGADAYAEGVLGAGAGGSITTVVKAFSGVKNVTVDLGEKMETRSAARESASIKDLVSNPARMDVAGAAAVMRHIFASPESSPEQKAEAVADLEKAFDHRPFIEMIRDSNATAIENGEDTDARRATVNQAVKIIAEMDRAAETLKITKDGIRGTSIEEAYKTLTAEDPVIEGELANIVEVDPGISRQAAVVVDESVNTPYSNFPTEMAREILEKRADILTPEQVENLRSYVTTNEAIDALEFSLKENNVRNDIVKGGNGNIGARTYVNAVISSIKNGEPEQAKQIAADLAGFAARHTAKAAALKTITDSFDAGTKMSPEEQVAIMAPFNGTSKKNVFKPFINAVPKYARMVQQEAAMLNIVSTEMNTRVSTLAVNPVGSPAVADPAQTTPVEQTASEVSTEPTANSAVVSATQAADITRPESDTQVTNESATLEGNSETGDAEVETAPAVSDEATTVEEITEPLAVQEQTNTVPTTEQDTRIVDPTNPAPASADVSPGRETPQDLPTPLISNLIDPDNNLVNIFLKVKDSALVGNPLLSGDNFIHKLRTEGISFEALKPYLPASVKAITPAQMTLLNNFLAFHEAFVASVPEVIGDNPIEFAYKDTINYFRDSNGQIKPAVLDAMAVSAFNWLIVNANDSLLKTPEDLGNILDVDSKNHTFSNYTWSTIGKAGLPFETVANSLGAEIIGNLGLQLTNNDAPHTLMARVATSFGARTIQTLAQVQVGGVPVVKFVNVSAVQREAAYLIETEKFSEVNAIKEASIKGRKGKYSQELRTVQVSFQLDAYDNRTPIDYIKNSVLSASSEAGPILNTLFNSLDAVAMPTFTPVSANQSSNLMKRTDRKVSSVAKKVIDKFNNTKTFVKPAMAKVFAFFDEQEISEMFGFETELEMKVHRDELESANSKNNLVKRNVQKVNEFLAHYNLETGSADYSVPFYLNMETTRVNRAQVTQSHMNMQSDKTARHMAYQEAWKAEIQFSDKPSVDKFMLAVGQALGVSVDKNYNSESLAKTLDILNKPFMQDGVTAAVAFLNDVATDDQMTDLKNAVMQGGKSAAVLDGIMAYAQYVDAFNKDQSSFTSTIGIEYDGVTNGPMIALTQFAFADQHWADNLKAGGIYINSALENVVDAKRQGNPDVYEKVTLLMDRILNSADSIPSSTKKDALSFKLDNKTKAALNSLFGVLTSVDPDTNQPRVSPEGRTIAKWVVTPKTYQASDAKTQAKLGEEALAGIRKMLGDLSKLASDESISSTKRAEIISEAKAIKMALDVLAPGLVVVTNNDYLNAQINSKNTYNYESIEGPAITMTLPEMLAATYGAMFTNAVNLVNKSMEDSTKNTVVATNIAVMLYEDARTKLIQQAVAAKAAKGVAGNKLSNELTVAEMKKIDAQLESVFPEVMTAISSEKGTGVSLVESNGSLSATEYKMEFKLTDKTNPAYSLDGEALKVPQVSTLTTPARNVTAPGVRGVVNEVLATDGAIALRGMDNSTELLSLYDAYMSGALDAVDNGKEWNKQMFKTVLEHSIPVNTSKMLNKVLTNYNLMFGETSFGEDILKKYMLFDYVEGGLDTDAIANIFERYTAEANQIQESKRQLLTSNPVTFNHYYSEGAAVTFINGELVNNNLENLDAEFVNAIQTASDQIVTDDIAADESAMTVPAANNKTTATSDNNLTDSAEVLALFADNDVVTLDNALNAIEQAASNSPTVNAVKAIVQAILAKKSKYTKVVQYNPAKTYEGDLAWLNTNQDIIQYARSSRGMFAPKNMTGNFATIVLMGPTMPFSGMNTETLFHEVVHSLFDEKVFANAASPVGAELQSLAKTVKTQLQSVMNNDPEAKAFIDSFGGPGKFPGLTNMREFLAWGLSSAQFQNILKQVTYVSKNELDNRLEIKPRTVLAKLRDLVQKVIFNRDIKSSTNEAVDNALNALITVSLATQSGTIGKAIPSISRQQGPMTQLYNITKLNSKQLFNTLSGVGHVRASGTHQAHLESMLNTVVNVVLNPLGVNVITAASNESLSDLSAHDKLEIFVDDNQGLQLNNLPPQYGFNKSAQESYVYGLYQSILEAGLKSSTPQLMAANKIFDLAKETMTYKDFMADPTNTDPVAIQEAKNRYSSVFTVSSSKIKVMNDPSSGLNKEQAQSDYLRNFLALAATNEQFRNALDKIKVNAAAAPVTLFERVMDILNRIIDLVSDRISGVDSVLSAKVNLDVLTRRLVGAELRAQSEAERVFNGSINYASYAMGSALNVFKKGLAKLGNLPAFRNNPFQAVRLASTIARITGNNRTQFAFEVMDELAQRMNQGKQTFVGEIATEIKGTVKENTKVHSLLRVANFTLDRGRKAVIEAMSKTLVAQFKGELTKIERDAVTKAILRTDMAALTTHGYSLSDMALLLEDANYRNQEIGKFEANIRNSVPTKLATYYLNQAEDLGFTMVNGYSSNVGATPNAYGIARLWGTGEQAPGADVLSVVEPMIDALASLRAIERTAAQGTHNITAANIIRREASRTDGDSSPQNNGLTFLLVSHNELKAKALKDNFGNNPALMRKGYMPDINNPYISIVTAPEADSAIMKEQGYKEMYELEKDPNDVTPGALKMFVGDGAGMAQYMRGALSTTGEKTKGTLVKDVGTVQVMHAKKYQEIQRLFTDRVSPNYGRNQAFMQPVYNPSGDVVDYRYVMAESTKDTLLSRNEDFSEVLGKLAGTVYDKATTKPHNQMVMDALKEQYDADVAAGRVDDYIRVTGRSPDSELADLYNLLPYETKQYAKKVFGTDSIPIRAEFLRVIFGYRKISIADVWKEGGVTNNHFQNAVKSMFEALFGSTGMQRASQFERVTQDLVRVAKSNIVVRTGSTTLMNVISNTYALMIQGLNMRDALADQVVGYKKGIEYVRHASRIAEVELLLQGNHNPSQRSNMEAEVAQLKHLQSINPVAELIEAGLLQTIVLDVNSDIDPFSYSSILANKLDRQLEKLPGKAADATKFVFMTRDSASFEFMNRMVQFSDFSARYAMYKHITTRAENQLDKATAIQEVITQFVNYDLPTHRAIQYGNDMGVLWFTRYWLRIQKVIVKNFAEHPARVLLGLALQGVTGADVPDHTDSSVLGTGILHPLRGIDGIGSGLMANPVIPNL